MKKALFTFLAIALAFNFSYAQWTGGPTGPVYYNGGNVGIGIASPVAKLHIYDGGTGASYSELLSLQTSYGPSGQKALTWRDPANITGSIATYFDGTYTNMSFGHLYNLEYQTSDLMTIMGSGQIGMGTTSPVAALHVARGGTNATTDYASIHISTTGAGDIYGPILYLDGSSGTSGRIWGMVSSCTSDAGTTGAAGNFAIYDGTSGNSRLVINASGNVGIGTTSPAGKLQVQTASDGSPLSVGAGFTNAHLVAGTSASGLAFSKNQTSGGSGYITSVTPTVSWDPLGFQAGNYNWFLGGSTTASMVLNGSGNVGIGTTTPQSKLDVSGNLRTSSYIFAYDSGSDEAILVNPGGGNNIQGVNSGNTAYKNITLQGGGGNVGIGTATPDQMLSVNGNIHAQEVLVNLSGFEDRVFKPKYHLLTLPEVKTYIDKNHHLPDVPSEAEVIKNGLKVGNMERTLTKKVEELTLYLIEKDKQLKLQDDRIKLLEAAFKAQTTKPSHPTKKP